MAILLAAVLCVSLCSCSAYEGDKGYEKHTNLIAIAGYDNLYYDPSTHTVYMLFNEALGNRGYGYMSAYYAPNGLPYHYNPHTNSLVEIQN